MRAYLLSDARIDHENFECISPPPDLVCDSTALQAATSWKPEYTLEQGLRETAAWFGEPANLAKYKVDQYNV